MSEEQHGKFNPDNMDGHARKKRFKIENGSNIYRVLPPFGALASQGVIAKYWAVYWLEDSRGKKKPVVSLLKVDKNKRVLQADPLHDKIEMLKKNLELMKTQGQNLTVVAALEEKVKGLRIDKAYYVNAINQAGEIGLLKLRYTAFQDLKQQIAKVSKEGVDPINVGVGIYFDFQKAVDDNNRTTYKVGIYQKTYKNPQTGKYVSEVVEAPIDADTLKRMDTQAWDLSTIYKEFSPEEQALAATMDPSVIDRLFARADEVEPEDGSTEEDTADLKAPETAVQAQTSAPASTVNNFAVNAAVAPAATTYVPPKTSQAPNVAATPQDMKDIVGNFLRGQGQA